MSALVQARERIRVWDLPLRVFHWSLVIAVATAVITGELGGSWMVLHGKAGLAIIGLVSFRLAWGLVGSTHARFLNFAPTPGRIKAYLRGQWRGVGHNPLGALSVFALLGLLIAQAATGLFSNDDIAFSGPLFNLVDEVLAGRLTGFHRRLAYVLFTLVALHVVAIVFYVRFKKRKLVRPMVTGWKEMEAAFVADDEGTRTEQGGGMAFAFSVGVAVLVVCTIAS